MSVNRILFCTGQGIGNIIQCIPVIKTLKEVLGYKIDFWRAYGNYTIPKNLLLDANNIFIGDEIYNINSNDYCGKIYTGWIRHNSKIIKIADSVLKMPKLAEAAKPLFMTRSEVDINIDIARDLGAKEEDLIWHGNCMYNKVNRNYDIVISNGYNSKSNTNWSIKSYPYYEEVIKLLNKSSKYKICSIGSKQEYINGTIDETGLPLLDSLGIIKNSRLLLSNDSGMYHCANALETPNVVIFTATSIEKNYDKRFHKYSTIVGRDDLTCRPCQAGHGWKQCNTWECREINPHIIASKIKEILV